MRTILELADKEGHLDLYGINFVAYGFGLSQMIENQEYKGRWPTFMNRISILLENNNDSILSPKNLRIVDGP